MVGPTGFEPATPSTPMMLTPWAFQGGFYNFQRTFWILCRKIQSLCRYSLSIRGKTQDYIQH